MLRIGDGVGTPDENGDIETVELDGRWVNRVIGSGVVVARHLNRSVAVEAGAVLARTWGVCHQVVYASAS